MEPSFNITNCSVAGTGGAGISIGKTGKIKIKDTFYLAVKGEKKVPFRTEDEAMRYVVRRKGWRVKDAYFSEEL